jgi:hypothetical protein
MLQDSIGLLALAAKVQNDELAGLLANRVSDYPITCAAVAIVGERYAEARLLLESAKPASALDEIVRLTMLLRAQVSDPATDLNEDGKTCRLWAERDLPTIKSLVDDLTDGRERVVLYAQLSFAQFASHHLAPEREQEIRMYAWRRSGSVADPVIEKSSLGARLRRSERLVEHLDESRAIERVTLAFIQLHELLDLLAHRPLDDAPLGRDHIAAFRSCLKEGLLNRDCNVVRLRELVWIHVSSTGLDVFRLSLLRQSREHVGADVASIVTWFDDTDSNSERSELSSQ